MKRAVTFVLALLLPVVALGLDLPAKYLVPISNQATWNMATTLAGVEFYAPFNDPADPLNVVVGDALTFTRAHDADHVATYLNPTTGLVTNASADQLRIESSGALVEAEGRNFFLWSTDFSQAEWAKNRCNPAYDNATAPDNNLKAARLIEDGTNGAHGFIQAANGTEDVGAVYTVSVYLKAGDRMWGAIDWNDGVAAKTGYFDLDNGVVGSVASPATSTIASVGNGWYRCSVSNTTAGASVSAIIATAESDGVFSFSGTIGKHLFVWGPQVEKGTVTSYIPSGASPFARTADALTFPTIASPGTATARVDGVMQEVNYATFDPVGHHVKDFREWSRTLSPAEITAILSQ